MNVMSVIYLICLLFAGIVCLFGLVFTKSFYTNPKILPSRPPVWWLYSKEGWIKFARSAPITPFYSSFGVVGVAFAEYGDRSSTVVKIIILSFYAILIAGAILTAFIAFTGHPKWLIPRHLRQS